MKLDMRVVPTLASGIGTLYREYSTFHLITLNAQAHEAQLQAAAMAVWALTVGFGSGHQRFSMVMMDWHRRSFSQVIPPISSIQCIKLS